VSRDIDLFVEDIIRCCGKVAEYTSGMDLLALSVLEEGNARIPLEKVIKDLGLEG
jgi:hypothetical protein